MVRRSCGGPGWLVGTEQCFDIAFRNTKPGRRKKPSNQVVRRSQYRPFGAKRDVFPLRPEGPVLNVRRGLQVTSTSDSWSAQLPKPYLTPIKNHKIRSDYMACPFSMRFIMEKMPCIPNHDIRVLYNLAIYKSVEMRLR